MLLLLPLATSHEVALMKFNYNKNRLQEGCVQPRSFVYYYRLSTTNDEFEGGGGPVFYVLQLLQKKPSMGVMSPNLGQCMICSVLVDPEWASITPLVMMIGSPGEAILLRRATLNACWMMS